MSADVHPGYIESPKISEKENIDTSGPTQVKGNKILK